MNRALRIAAALAALVSGLTLSPSATAWEQCFVDAGARYQVSPLLLRAIARQESSFRPDAVNKNTNGTRDIGVMQINTFWMSTLGKAGITEEALFQPCLNIHVGAWVLADAISRHGMTWKAIGAYHSPTEWRQVDYAARIQRHLIRELRAMGSDIPLPPAPPRVPTKPAELAQASPAPAAKPSGGVWESAAGAEVDSAVKTQPESPEGSRVGG